MQTVGIAETSVRLGLSPDVEVEEEPTFIKILKAELERLHVGIDQLHQLSTHRPPPPARPRRRWWA
jgi:hypothetical protein